MNQYPKRISTEQLKNETQFMNALADLLSEDGTGELIRDLCECQSLLRSHPLLNEVEIKRENLIHAVHQLEVALRSIQEEQL